MNFKPLSDRVLIVQDEAQTTTASGLVIAPSAAEQKCQGVAVAVGPGRVTDDGELQEMHIEVGDKVLFSDMAAKSSIVKIDGNDFILLPQTEIYGVFR